MLFYESTGKVRAAVARSIARDLETLDRDWWRGSLGIDAGDDERPAVLTGRTALFHRTHGIPDADDLFMAFADAAFILERLCDWARRHRIKWHIRMHDDDWGAVDPSGLTPPLLDQMGKWAHRTKIFPSGRDTWSIPEERRAELLARHAGRKEV